MAVILGPLHSCQTLGCDARQASCGRVANRSGWDDGLIYYDRDYRSDGSTRLVLTKRYWAYAQFSRWVRPGRGRTR